MSALEGPMFDPAAIHMAHALYRTWRLRRWQKKERARKLEDARVKALYSLPEPKHWPGHCDAKKALEEAVRLCLSPLGQDLGIGVVESHAADGFIVSLTRGVHSVTTAVRSDRADDAHEGFRVARVLLARLEDIATKADAVTPVRVHQTPLR